MSDLLVEEYGPTCLEIARQLLQMREEVREQLGPRFNRVMGDMGCFIEFLAKRDGLSIATAALNASTSVIDHHPTVFIAAAIELLEETRG